MNRGHEPSSESAQDPDGDFSQRPKRCVDSASADDPRPTAWRFAAPVLLAALILLVYMPALDAGFVGWDDDDLLLNTTRYQTIDSDSLWWMFTTSYTGHFQPLTWLTFWMDWALWHREAFGYHLTNVLLHILTAVVFYFISRRLLARNAPTDRGIHSAPVVGAALLAAILFAIHPLRVESVAWVAERRDVLSGLFVVLSVACYLRFATVRRRRLMMVAKDPTTSHFRTEHPGARRFYLFSIAFCGLSLLAKASAMMLPLALLILDVYPLRRWRRAGRATDRSVTAPFDVDAARPKDTLSLPLLIWEKVPFFVLAFAAGVRALIAQEEGGALQDLAIHGLGARLAQACHGLVFYVDKTLWPTQLGPLYEIPPSEILFGPALWVSIFIIVVMTTLAIALRRRLPALGAALGIYIVVLFPVLGIAQSGPQFVADRYSYLSCMGFALLGGAGWLALRRRLHGASRTNVRAMLALGTFAVVVALGNATLLQADIWFTGQTLWARGLDISPNSAIAHTNYADALVSTEQFGDAEYHYRQALTINPRDAVALHHLGVLREMVGDDDAAVYCYHRALMIDPNRQRACFALALLLVKRGHASDAVTILRDGAQRHPEALEMIDYLAVLLAAHPDETVRNPDEAIHWAQHVNRARRFGFVPALMTLATAHAAAGEFDRAINFTEQALNRTGETTTASLVVELRHRLELFRQGKPYRFNERSESAP